MDSREWMWTLMAGLAYGAAALLFNDALGYTTAPSAQPLVVGSVVGGAVIGAAAWAVLVERRGGNPIVMASLGGCLAGTVSHPVMWAVYGVASMSPVITLVGPVFLSFWSLFFFGWITAPMAALVGCGMGGLRWVVDRRKEEAAEKRANTRG